MVLFGVRILPLLPTISRLVLSRPTAYGSRNHAIRYYWSRRDPLSEISSVMQSLERNMREMDKEMARFFDEFQRGSPVRFPRFLSPRSWSRSRDIPVESSSEESPKYQIELDVQDIRPEEITVTVRDNLLTVQARRDEKKTDGSRFHREYYYQYNLPEDVNPESVRCIFSDGILKIEAPLPALKGHGEPKEIPVQKEEKIENK